MEIQAILDKYSPETFNSLNLENNLLDIEKELIFEKEHQIPSLITSSKRPFDKNICYYDLPLVKTIKENIIPKNKYKLKSLKGPIFSLSLNKYHLLFFSCE